MRSKDANAPTRAPRAVTLVAGNLVVLLVIALCFEGCASLLLLARDWQTTLELSERRHTRYDSDLGWVNEAEVAIPDLYGPGRSLHTNARGFRALSETSERATPGLRRVLCAGDSFTLGFGVDDHQTWCQLLGEIGGGIETVNMGQGGYGTDQSYLWYERDAASLEHDLLLLAFIWDDFSRMLSSDFLGYGKPRLGLENGALVVGNTPVPRRAYAAPWLTRNIRQLEDLKSVELATRAGRALGLGSGDPTQSPTEARSEAQGLLRAIFSSLLQLTRERSSQLVLVFLPTIGDHQGDEVLRWTSFVEGEAARLGIPFVNLVEGFRALRPRAAKQLFIQPGEIPLPHAEWHYNEKGNRTIARALWVELAGLPPIVDALGLSGDPRQP